MKTLVKDLMTYPLVTIPVNSKVRYARELMDRKSVNALPVVNILEEELEVVGIITSTDLRNVSDENDPIDRFMTKNFQSVKNNQSALSAAHRMLHTGVHHLLVFDGNKAVGMLSSIDFVRMLISEKERLSSRIMFV